MALHDSSFQYRLQIWRGTLAALWDFWLWGTGPGGFARVYAGYKVGNFPSQHAHQLYLQFWLEYGILSLVTFLAIMKRLFQQAISRCSPNSKMLIMVLAAFLIYGLSETWYIHPFSGGFFFFLTGLIQVECRRSQEQSNVERQKSNVKDLGTVE